MPQHTRRVAALAAALLTAVTVGGCSLQPDVSSKLQPDTRTNQPAPALKGTTLTGATLNLASMRGHPVVLNFWASWCGPCRLEQPEVNALAAKYSGLGVRFLGVDIRDDRANALAFTRQFKVAYPSIFDPANDVAGAFAVDAPPSTLVIDAAGNIRLRLIGSVSEIPATLDALLGRT